MIVLIETRPFKGAADRKIVTPFYPTDRVVPVEGGSGEDRIGKGSKTEVPGDAERFDRLIRRLINVLHAEVADSRSVVRRMAARYCAGYSEPKIIEQGRAENVGFLNRRVVGTIRGVIGVGKEIVVRENSRLVVPSFVEAEIEAVAGGNAVIQADEKLIKILNHGRAVKDQAVGAGAGWKILQHGERGRVETAGWNLIAREGLSGCRVLERNRPMQRVAGVACVEVGGEIAIQIGGGGHKRAQAALRVA